MAHRSYNLGFISDESIRRHVLKMVQTYRTTIHLKEFSKNIVDPIKLTFDSKIYRHPTVIDNESCDR